MVMKKAPAKRKSPCRAAAGMEAFGIRPEIQPGKMSHRSEYHLVSPRPTYQN
jgi:hypothetical protein